MFVVLFLLILLVSSVGVCGRNLSYTFPGLAVCEFIALLLLDLVLLVLFLFLVLLLFPWLRVGLCVVSDQVFWLNVRVSLPLLLFLGDICRRAILFCVAFALLLGFLFRGRVLCFWEELR